MDFCKCFAIGCQKFNCIGQIVVSISLRTPVKCLLKIIENMKTTISTTRDERCVMEKAGNSRKWEILKQTQTENCLQKMLHVTDEVHRTRDTLCIRCIYEIIAS